MGPYVTFDQVQPLADGPVGPFVTLSPVGSDGIHSRCDSDQPVADGPVGPSVTLGPVGPGGMLSQFNSDQPVADGPVGPLITLSPVGSDGMHSLCDSDQPLADGPVGPSVTLGPVGPGGTLFQCNSDQPMADGPVGPSVKQGLLGLRGMSVQIDINDVVTTDNTCVPTNTEEDKVTICPLIDCLSKEKSDESPEIDMLDSDSDSQWNKSEEFYSDQELTTDESQITKRGLIIKKTRRLCGIQWTRRICQTYIDNTQLNSVRTGV